MMHSNYPLARLLRVAVGTVVTFVLASSAGAQALDLQQAVRLALEHNFDLRIQAHAPGIAVDQLAIARGELDPAVYARFSVEENERLQNLVDLVSTNVRRWEEKNRRAEAGVGGLLPFGTEYRLFTSLDVLENSINRRAPGFNGPLDLNNLQNLGFGPLYSPEYVSFAGVAVTQPLLKGFGRGSALARTNVARIEVEAADLERHLAITNQLIAVVNAFYDLAFASENIAVKRQAVELAGRFRDETSRKLDLGRVSAIDVDQADVKLSEAKEELILAEDFRRDRQIALMRLIVPTWKPDSAFEPYTLNYALAAVAPPTDVAELTRAALRDRPDARLTHLRRDQELLRFDYANTQTKPTLDLQLRAGVNGYAGSTRDSYDRASEAREPSWAVGVAFNYPIGNRSARAEKRLAGRRRDQAELAIEKVQTEISLQVLNSARRIETYLQRLETAVKSRELAENTLAAEEKRFEKGLTSSFNVLEFQTKLSDVRTREVAARIDLQKAQAELWSVTGQLPRHLGVEIVSSANRRDADFKWW